MVSEIWMPSPHYSTSRGPYNKIAFHTTEGAMTIEALGNWFANPSAGCSSHHGADQYKRTLGAYVYEQYKAWTQGNANPYCLSLEMCAYASWSRSTWLGKPVLLDNAAEWLRYCVDKYAIPWTLLNDSQAQNPDVRGICQHVNFGSWGSGHHDCGGGFPMDVVIDKARKWGSSPGEPHDGGDMAVACYTWQDQNYYAGLGTNGEVKFRQPGGEFFAVDTSQSGAKSGCGLTITTAGKVTISYTNGKGAACIYERASGGGTWGWASISPDNSFR